MKPKEEKSSSGFLVALLVLLVLAAGLVVHVLKRRGLAVSKPTAKRPKAVSDLLDPEDRNLAPAEIITRGCSAAREEDWMKAMRYLFAALLTHLVEDGGVPIRDIHTNLEIAGLLSTRPLWSESFWSAATVFELFWFGQRRPMENDYRLFETFVADCRSQGRRVGQ